MRGTWPDLSDFETLQSLGEGSFSRVKLVKRLSDGKLLALKQVSMDKLGHHERDAALNEIRLLASIQSPHVISYHGSFYSATSNSLCLLMEYADGGDLELMINSQAKQTNMQRGLPQPLIWRTLIHLLQGLRTLHSNNIVHRDLKSANIFYSKGVSKIGDLNVSCVSDSTFYSTKTGTPYYTAPEIWRGEHYTNNCDIWSLGCIVYEMCALLPPFKAQSFPELFVAVSRGEYKPLSQDYSDELRTVVRMCLALDYRERPSAAQLLGGPILLRKLAEFKDDVSLEGKVDLIKPIKCPKALKLINTVLPPSEGQIVSSPLPSDKYLRKNRKVVRIQAQSPESKNKSPSINKRKMSQPNLNKSTIRIKSCSKIRIGLSKSVGVIKDIGDEDDRTGEEEQGRIDLGESKISGYKENNRMLLQPISSPKSKMHTSKMRVYRKLGEKENVGAKV